LEGWKVGRLEETERGESATAKGGGGIDLENMGNHDVTFVESVNLTPYKINQDSPFFRLNNPRTF